MKTLINNGVNMNKVTHMQKDKCNLFPTFVYINFEFLSMCISFAIPIEVKKGPGRSGALQGKKKVV